MIDRPRRYHYAFALQKVRGGWRLSRVLEARSRGEEVRL
jgi:hypothetical protein